MSAPVFHQIGPFEIQRQIGRGGMALVFLAQDTRPDGRVVALKVIADGPDADARDAAAAERRGAELQRQFLADSDYVPRVYEIGQTSGYTYIAMEYLEGEDLASLIRRGPVEPRQATRIAIQLCAFLEEIDHLGLGTDGSSALTLLHNDLKPTNVRLVAGDRVKVLDFGAAKALSMSRVVTRNDFYSTPYLSPECLDSGERDRQTDAWALGVILYEMVAGHPPFRAHDTRRLEDRIRSRRPPEPLAACPRALQAIIAKLLAPYPLERYESASAIREDLERFTNETTTVAEEQGWPDRGLDEPATRRVMVAVGDEPPTRQSPRRADENALDAVQPIADVAPVVTPPAPPAAPASPSRRWLRILVVTGLLSIAGNEACVMRQAGRVAATVPMQDFAGLTTAWNDYDTLRGRSYLGVGAQDLGRVLQRQTLVLAERVAANYRTPAPTVREAQWTATAKILERAVVLSPSDGVLRGTLRYAQGHLSRIDGEADKSRRQAASAQRNFAEAVAAFRESAALRPEWPDPFLGLARTFIYGLEDIDRGADAMAQAQKLGHAIGSRETAQMADGYRVRGESLERGADTLRGMPQEREMLTRSRDAFRKALELYGQVADLADAPGNIRTTQRRLDGIERKLADLDKPKSPGEVISDSILTPLRDLFKN